MKRIMLFAAVLALVGAGSLAAKEAKTMKGHGSHGAHGEEMKSKVTLKGEIIDLSCYMSHEGKGEKHRKCARACVLDKGLPMGLLTGDGKVYVLIEDHAKAKPFKQAKQLTADSVEISGMRHSRGGTVAVSVESVKKL